jgi:hypothetical protein
MERGGRTCERLLLGALAFGMAAGCGRATRTLPEVSEGVAGSAASDGEAGAPVIDGGAPRDDGALAQLLSVVCTTPDCVAGLDFEVLRVTRGIEAGRLSIDLDALEACLLAAPNVYLFDSRTVAPPPECDALWIPLTPSGGACDTDFACIDGFCQRSDYSRSRPEYAAGGCGVCTPRGELGAACSGHGWTGADRECAPGLRCGCEDGTSDCVTQCWAFSTADAGEHCALHIPCGDGLACVYAPGAVAGTCEPMQVAGASCTSDYVCPDSTCLDLDASGVGHCGPRRTGEGCASDYECAPDAFCDEGSCALAREGTRCWASGSCSDGSVCDDSARLCRPRAGHGQDCQSSTQCPQGDDCVEGACRVVLGLGAACDSSPAAVNQCAKGATCVDGVCSAARLGDACTTDCASGACEDGRCVSLASGAACGDSGAWDGDPCGAGLECGDMTCEPRPAAGEPCTALGFCESGYYCSGCGSVGDCDTTAICRVICVLDDPARDAPR